MAESLNNMRALRLAEIMQDFRNLQHYIAQIPDVSTAEEYNGAGHVLLRRCLSEGRAILHTPFRTSGSSPRGDAVAEAQHLRMVLLDASLRRFQAQRIYLRATAAMRWINSRNSVLDGQSPSSRHTAALARVDQALQTELAGITDQRVMHDLRSTDQAQGKWVAEDPSLEVLYGWLNQRA